MAFSKEARSVHGSTSKGPPETCYRCARPFDVQCAGYKMCIEHYDAWLDANPEFKSDVHRKLDEVMAAHPEWRRDDETKTEYNRRMIGINKELAKRVYEKTHVRDKT